MFKIIIFVILFCVLGNCQFCCVDCPIEDWPNCDDLNIGKVYRTSFICTSASTVFSICGISKEVIYTNDSTICYDLSFNKSSNELSTSSSITSTTSSSIGTSSYSTSLSSTSYNIATTNMITSSIPVPIDCSYCYEDGKYICSTKANETNDCFCNLTMLEDREIIYDCNGNIYSNSVSCQKRYSIIHYPSNLTILTIPNSMNAKINTVQKSGLSQSYFVPVNKLDDTQTVSIELYNFVLSIYVTGIDNPYALISKDLDSYLIAINATPQLINLPYSYFEKSGKLFVAIQDNFEIVYNQYVQIEEKKMCPSIDCSITCLGDYYKYMKCKHHSTDFIIVVVVLSVTFLILVTMCWFCPCLSTCFKFLLSVLFACITGPFTKGYEAMKQGSSGSVFTVNVNTGTPRELDNLSKSNSESNVAQANLMIGNNFKPKKMDWFLLLSIIMCIIVITQSCDTGFIQQSSFTNCVNYGPNQQKCGIILSVQDTISNINQESCIGFVDNTTNTPLFTIDITYNSATAVFLTKFLYITSNWTFLAIQNHECGRDGKCKDGFCAEVNVPDLTSVTANGELVKGVLANNPVVKIPGVTGCDTSCANGDENCPACSNTFKEGTSCIFWRYGMMPNNLNETLCAVYDTNELQFFVNLTVVVKDGLNNTIYSGTIGSFTGNTVSILNNTMNIGIEGEYLKTIPLISGRKIINCPQFSAIVDANDLNIRVANAIGDIQASTLEDLQTITTTSFVLPTGLITGTEQTDSLISWTHANPGWPDISSYSKLPQIIDGNLWSLIPGTALLTSNIINPGAAVVSVITNNNFSIIEYTNVVCPKITYLNASGCYDCDAGFTIYIQGHSSCASGLAILYVNNPDVLLATTSIQLATTNNVFMIRGSTSVKDNNFILTSSFQQYNSSVNVKFTAYLVSNVDNTTLGGGSGTHAGGDKHDLFSWNPFDALKYLFKGIGSWENSLYSAIIIIVIIIVLVLIVVVSVYLGVPTIFRTVIFGSIKKVFKRSPKKKFKPIDEDDKDNLSFVKLIDDETQSDTDNTLSSDSNPEFISSNPQSIPPVSSPKTKKFSIFSRRK